MKKVNNIFDISQIVGENRKKGLTIQRFKGLGEMIQINYGKQH